MELVIAYFSWENEDSCTGTGVYWQKSPIANKNGDLSKTRTGLNYSVYEN